MIAPSSLTSLDRVQAFYPEWSRMETPSMKLFNNKMAFWKQREWISGLKSSGSSLNKMQSGRFKPFSPTAPLAASQKT